MEYRHDLVTVGSRNGAAVAMLLLIAFYCVSNPSTRQGSFFGVMTKHLCERGSSDSKQPQGKIRSAAMDFRTHDKIGSVSFAYYLRESRESANSHGRYRKTSGAHVVGVAGGSGPRLPSGLHQRQP